jgi:3-hydroxyisobutyrate dehydrogenase-like beta-hydroxyacid dehydrogenase
MSDRPRLAYIGVGLMGGPMSERLSSLGYPVCAFDIDSARLTAAERAGAGRAKDAADAASNAELVLLNLPSAQAVEEAAFGSHGFARGLRPPQLVVDFSTISAATCREFAERVAQSSGCGWVDAPVSGGPVAAANGSLTIMAGGSDADIGRVQPLMGEIGQQFTHVGPTGAGSVAKTIAQLVVGCTYVVLAEAARLAEGAGIDPAILPRCVSKRHADGVLMQHLYPRVAAHDFAPRAYARQLLKDLEAVQDLARVAKTPAPMSGLATQLYRLLIAAGHSEIDACGIYRLYEAQPSLEPLRQGARP